MVGAKNECKDFSKKGTVMQNFKFLHYGWSNQSKVFLLFNERDKPGMTGLLFNLDVLEAAQEVQLIGTPISLLNRGFIEYIEATPAQILINTRFNDAPATKKIVVFLIDPITLTLSNDPEGNP
jgi:hypothetical protein